VAALDAGMDDYVTKPLGMEELRARFGRDGRWPMLPLVVGHFNLETFDHMIMFSIQGDQGESLLDRRRRYQRIEDVWAM
jgi:hypothetical protein